MIDAVKTLPMTTVNGRFHKGNDDNRKGKTSGLGNDLTRLLDLVADATCLRTSCISHN